MRLYLPFRPLGATVRQDDHVLNRRRGQGLLLAGTLATAAGVTGGISAWVLAVDPGAGVSEALRTGGLAGRRSWPSTHCG
jgi:hypothetical protein